MRYFLPKCVVLFAMLEFCTMDPCCRPHQWTANVVDTTGEYNRDLDSASLAYGNRNVYYDYEGKQLAFVDESSNRTAHTDSHTRVIWKYKEGKMYHINLIANNCTTADITGQTMEDPCIPADATSFGRHTYPGQVSADIWFFADKVSGGTRRLGVTTDKCLPLTESKISGGPDYVLRMSLYQNVTVGISDPFVFNVPAICSKGISDQKVLARFGINPDMDIVIQIRLDGEYV